jgi:Flp pilus assembly protein TadG
MRHVSEGPTGGRTGRRRTGRRGAEVVEFGLVLIPLLGFTGLIIDIGWGVFARSTLQHAVREGVRYAVTSRTIDGMGHVDSIKQVVQSSALGLLNGSSREKIKVRFYAPDTLSDISNQAGANMGGNLVEVAVEDFAWAPLMPVGHAKAPLRLTARSLDRMESSPPGGPPDL